MENNINDPNYSQKKFNERDYRNIYNNRCISDIKNNNQKLADTQYLGKDIILEQR